MAVDIYDNLKNIKGTQSNKKQNVRMYYNTYGRTNKKLICDIIR